VKEREIVAEFDFDTEDRRGPDMLALWMVCARGHSAVEARRAVDALIARVLAEGVTARELEKARNAIRGAFVFGLESTLSRAQYLAMTELYDGDAALVNTELARYEAVTRDDILRVARRYLVPTNRLVLEVRPVAPATSAATPSR
jgi:predicted Zn-dependent peptidase